MRKSEFEKLAAQYTTTEEIKYNPPCSADDYSRFSERLNLALPAELAELLQDSDGLEVYYSLSVWSLQEIANVNVEYWAGNFLTDLYMPFNSLLFFADAGNGDLFAYRILEEKISDRGIYVWNHENDSRVWIASNLHDFVT